MAEQKIDLSSVSTEDLRAELNKRRTDNKLTYGLLHKYLSEDLLGDVMERLCLCHIDTTRIDTEWSFSFSWTFIRAELIKQGVKLENWSSEKKDDFQEWFEVWVEGMLPDNDEIEDWEYEYGEDDEDEEDE